MEKYYCSQCYQLFESKGICPKCLLDVKQEIHIVVHKNQKNN